MTISERLARLEEAKSNLKQALINSGVSIPDNMPFSDYVKVINEVKLGGVTKWTQEDYEKNHILLNSYTRPKEWLDLPEVREGEQKIVCLVKVSSDNTNRVKFSVKVDKDERYLVDWGNGSVKYYGSDEIVDYNYDYNYDYSGSVHIDEDGLEYKQVIITMTTDHKFIEVDFSMTTYKPQLWSNSGIKSKWMEISMAGEDIKNILISGTDIEVFNFVGYNEIDSFDRMFQDCSMLKCVSNLYTGRSTNFSNMFYMCRSLKSLPSLDTSNGVYMDAMFARTGLETVPYISLESAEDIGWMFGESQNLVNIPNLNLKGEKLGYIGWLFDACISLTLYPVLDFGGKELDLDGLFYGNSFTKSPTLIGTENIKNFSDLFGYCTGLKDVTYFNTSSGEWFSSTFYHTDIDKIPNIDLSSAIGVGGMFHNCKSLVNVSIDLGEKTIYASNLFQDCINLKSVKISIDNVTYAQGMFEGCTLLNNVSEITGHIPFYSSSMFRNCTSLNTFPDGIIFKKNTNNLNPYDDNQQHFIYIDSMFYGCSSLSSIKPFSFDGRVYLNGLLAKTAVSDIPKMEIDTWSLDFFYDQYASYWTNSNFQYISPNLRKFSILNIKSSLRFVNSNLSRESIIEIFNNLTDESGYVWDRRISMTDVWGARLLSQLDRKIATDKGWTILG